jgi:hypothetical protein
MNMKSPKNSHPGPRVFVIGLSFCEIVYLPETGQIVSRLAGPESVREDRKIRTAGVAEDESQE